MTNLNLNEYDAGYIFRIVMPNKNFMTPEILRYLTNGKTIIIELSRGKGINNKTILGLTTIELVDGQWQHAQGKSEMFTSLYQMNKYAKELLREAKE
jgi:hypothetical protein